MFCAFCSHVVKSVSGRENYYVISVSSSCALLAPFKASAHSLQSPFRANPFSSVHQYSTPRSRSKITTTARRDRIDPKDEAFVTCDHCGTDVVVSATKLIERGDSRVKCPQCYVVWHPRPEDALTDDGVPLLKSLEEKRQQLRQTANSPAPTTPIAMKPPPTLIDESSASVRLYIAGLGPKVNANALRAALEVYGRVTDVNVVFDRATGRSKGFGFATVIGTSAASAAIEDLSGSTTLGRRLIVRKAFA